MGDWLERNFPEHDEGGRPTGHPVRNISYGAAALAWQQWIRQQRQSELEGSVRR